MQNLIFLFSYDIALQKEILVSNRTYSLSCKGLSQMTFHMLSKQGEKIPFVTQIIVFSPFTYLTCRETSKTLNLDYLSLISPNCSWRRRQDIGFRSNRAKRNFKRKARLSNCGSCAALSYFFFRSVARFALPSGLKNLLNCTAHRELKRQLALYCAAHQRLNKTVALYIHVVLFCKSAIYFGCFSM